MQGAIFYLLTVLIWGSTWFAIKFQLGVVDPSVSLVYRFGLAALLLLAWCLLRRIRLAFTPSEHLAMALSGIVLVLLGNVMVVGRGLGARWRRRVAVA